MLSLRDVPADSPASENAMSDRPGPHRAYMRDLPGGGFAAIDVSPRHRLFGHAQYQGEILVERRANWRRTGHQPPVVARAVGATFEAVVHQLLPLAESNAAIGAALLDQGLAPNQRDR